MRFLGLIPLLWTASTGFGEIVSKRLDVGSSFTTNFSEDASIHTSKDGFLDLVKDEKGKWVITALKEGFAFVQERAEDGRILLRYNIHISASEKNQEEKWDELDTVLRNRNLSRDEDRITGYLSDWTDIPVIEVYCAKLNCRVRVELTSEAQTALQRYAIESFGQNIDVRWNASTSSLEYRAPCKQDLAGDSIKLQSYIKNALKFKNIVPICASVAGTSLVLKAAMLLKSKNRARSFGVNPALDAKSTLNLAAINNRYEDAGEIIGEPEAVFVSGNEIIIRSGGEFKSEPFRDDAQKRPVEWKPYGIEMRIMVRMETEGTLHTAIDARISTPIGKDLSALQGHAIKTALLLQMGDPVRAATSQMHSSFLATNSDFSLADIPIFGPIFRVQTNHKDERQIELWVCVDTLDRKACAWDFSTKGKKN